MNMTGMAALCFTHDDKQFHGHYITDQKSQVTLQGSGTYKEMDKCCYKDEALSYRVLVRFYESKKDIEYSNIIRHGADNCTLKSDHFYFNTNQLLVGEKAETFIVNYIDDWRNKNCYVCLGNLEIHPL